MTTSAKIILDSISPLGNRIITMQLRYPRFVHSEFMTHRMFSRNASSSRAIPVAKMIEQVRNEPAMPCHWGKNQPGMQANAEVEGMDRTAAESLWMEAANKAAKLAEDMAEIGLHKQVANRILEPFQWMHVIVTATEWDNFFSLRLHPAAEPNIQLLAQKMREAIDTSTPIQRTFHAPYIEHQSETFSKDIAMVSSARCARVSYLNHDGTDPDWDKDRALANKLQESRHASPFEHVAVAEDMFPHTNANFRGWASYRYILGI